MLQTDLEAYHFQAESFLHDWICSSEVITYTQKGRAWNANKGASKVARGRLQLPGLSLHAKPLQKDAFQPQHPADAPAGSMDVTANAAMMAAVYGKSIMAKDSDRANRYICWAKGQIRFLLGDVVNAAVVVSRLHRLAPLCAPRFRNSWCARLLRCKVQLQLHQPPAAWWPLVDGRLTVLLCCCCRASSRPSPTAASCASGTTGRSRRRTARPRARPRPRSATSSTGCTIRR